MTKKYNEIIRKMEKPKNWKKKYIDALIVNCKSFTGPQKKKSPDRCNCLGFFFVHSCFGDQ